MVGCGVRDPCRFAPLQATKSGSWTRRDLHTMATGDEGSPLFTIDCERDAFAAVVCFWLLRFQSLSAANWFTHAI
jgi:hypothetical protein